MECVPTLSDDVVSEADPLTSVCVPIGVAPLKNVTVPVIVPATPDVTVAAEAIRQAGVPLAKEVHQTAWGTREFVIRDDQGHTLYFGEAS